MKPISQITLGEIARQIPVAIVAIIFILGLVLLMGEDIPDAPIPFSQWLLVKAAGIALIWSAYWAMHRLHPEAFKD